jgi:hypothetical protein
LGSKTEKRKFQDVWMSEFSWLIDDSNKDIMTNMYCYVCRKAGPDIADKTDFVTGKKLKREIIVYHKCSGNINSPTGYQYGIFTHIL